MICLVCYLAEVESTCGECGKPLCACDMSAEDMGENYCANCDSHDE